jgi:hypothetical protein
VSESRVFEFITIFVLSIKLKYIEECVNYITSCVYTGSHSLRSKYVKYTSELSCVRGGK